jgi:type I restriction enzyme S subunit
MSKRKYRPYPEYKDSGVEWIGQIPAHWSILPLKYLLQANDGGVWGEDPSGTEDTIVLRSTEQTVDGEWAISSPASRNLSEKERKAALLTEGDLLITKSSGSALHIGKTSLVDTEIENLQCCFSNFMQRIRPKECLNSRLTWYFLNNSVARLQFDLLANSTTGLANLNGAIIESIIIPLPSKGEQQSLKRYLDRETSRIDRLIEKKERFIELLKEKRQALITHAVTKGLPPEAAKKAGLDPNPPMKDSGIEWIGEVPAHWEILNGSWIGMLFGSEQVPDSDISDFGEIPFIKVASLSPDSFEIQSWSWFISSSVSREYKTRSNYVVFPKRGAAIFLNKVNIVEEASLIDPNLMGWEIGEKAIPRFIAYLLKARKLTELADVSTVPQINNKHIGPEKFPVPPIEEQNLIVHFLDTQSTRIEQLQIKTQRSIDLLRERRTALITAAVTGQIDVREAVPDAYGAEVLAGASP